MTSVLIIGADSFIASNFIKTYRDIFSFRLLSRFPIEESGAIVLTDFFKLENAIFENIEVVINFVAIVHKPQIKDETSYRKINFELPLLLAEKSYKSGVKLFIQMSTMAVYGDLNTINIHSKSNPTTLYGLYKLKTDDHLLSKYSDSSMQVACIRPSMVYGAGIAPGNLARLIKLANLKLPLPFKGIENIRQFCNIHLLLALLRYVVENRITGIILIADSEGISTHKIISLIKQLQSNKNYQFNARIFWKIVSYLKPGLVKKLTDNLIIESNFDNHLLGLGEEASFSSGLREML